MSSEPEAPVEAPIQWPVIVRLKYPIDFAGEQIAELKFRRGKLGDLDGLNLEAVPPINQLVLIASRMCATPLAAMKLLGEDDVGEVLEIALGFFTRCLVAGKKASRP